GQRRDAPAAIVGDEQVALETVDRVHSGLPMNRCWRYTSSSPRRVRRVLRSQSILLVEELEQPSLVRRHLELVGLQEGTLVASGHELLARGAGRGLRGHPPRRIATPDACLHSNQFHRLLHGWFLLYAAYTVA